MAKYVYPAIFAKEDKGAYSVLFPDIANCYTDGNDMSDALEKAEDVLCLMLYDMEKEGKAIPEASEPRSIEVDDDEFINMVAVDTEFYHRYYSNKLIRKSLNIPMWLNAQAERANVNFSAILQEALKTHLNIAE
jgi:predicted RNase H-like HicB family nuclease